MTTIGGPPRRLLRHVFRGDNIWWPLLQAEKTPFLWLGIFVMRLFMLFNYPYEELYFLTDDRAGPSALCRTGQLDYCHPEIEEESMYGTVRCELCGAVAPVGETARVAGMELCGPCNGGDFAGRLADRGLRLQWIGEDWHREGGGRSGSGSMKVRGAIPYDLGLSAIFSREDWFSKVGKLFGKELQVGDKEFDDAIYIRTQQPETLGEALEDEGLRAAVRHLVESTQSVVTVEEGTVELSEYTIEPELEPRRAALRDIAVLLHRLERRAVALRLPHRPELATYPDLRKTIEYVRDANTTLGDNRYLPIGLQVLDATVDHLGPVAQVHDPMARTKMALEVLQLARVHILAGGLGPLSGLSSLRQLELDQVPGAQTLPPLAGLQRLEELTITRSSVTDISPLAGLVAIRELKLNHLPLTEIGPLSRLRSLRKLDLRGTQVVDVSPLAKLPELEHLWIQGLPIPDQQVRALRQANPGLDFDPY